MFNYLNHPLYRYVIYMFILYFIYKTAPNLNIKNKVLTHMSLLATIVLYIIDNVSKGRETMKNIKNKKYFKKRKIRKKPQMVILKKQQNDEEFNDFNDFNNLNKDYSNIPNY